MAPAVGKSSISLWNLITSGPGSHKSYRVSSASSSSSPSSGSSSTTSSEYGGSPPATLTAISRQLSVSDGCLLRSVQQEKATTAERATMAGWVTKQVGSRLKSWRRRFMVLDRYGTLSLYGSEKDASFGRKATDVIPASNMRHVLRRERSDSGQWPSGVCVEVCLQICVLKGRTQSIVCDSKAECVEWVRRLTQHAGNPRTQVNHTEGDGSESTPQKHSGTGRRSSLDHAVRSPPKPKATTWTTMGQWSSDPATYGLHSGSSIPSADRECFLKWLKVAELTMRRFEKICRLPAYSISLECNMEWMYHSTPAADRARLGEYVFGDYPDELLHNLSPLLEHPVGRALFLSQMPSSKIIITYKHTQIRNHAPHSVSQHHGALQIAVDPRRLGKEMTSVGLSFLDDARVSRSQLIRSEFCGDVVFISYLGAVDILTEESMLADSFNKLKRCASWPLDEELQLKCLWYDMEAAVLSHPDGGFNKSRTLGKVVIGGVVVPMLQQLTALCRNAPTWQLSTSLYYKISKRAIVVEINRSSSSRDAVVFCDGCLFLRPTISQLVDNTFFHVIQSVDIPSMVSHSETIV